MPLVTLLCFLISVSSWAAPVGSPPKPREAAPALLQPIPVIAIPSEPPARREATPSATPSVAAQVPVSASQAGWQISIGPGLAVYQSKYSQMTSSGNVGFAVNVGAVVPLPEYPQVRIGLDFALNYWNYDSATPTTTLAATGVQALPTAYYQFDTNLVYGLHPYIGLSMGPHFLIGKATRLADGTTSSETTIYVEALIRPGIEWQTATDLAFHVEPKFGMLGGDFIFLPQVDLNLSL